MTLFCFLGLHRAFGLCSVKSKLWVLHLPRVLGCAQGMGSLKHCNVLLLGKPLLGPTGNISAVFAMCPKA